MPFHRFHITFLLLVLHPLSNAQNLLDRKVTLSVTSQTIESVIDKIAKTEKITFSYKGNLPQLKKVVSVNYKSVELRQVLDVLLMHSKLVYIEFANQILLVNKPEIAPKIEINLQVLDMLSHNPVSFATIEWVKRKSGFMADGNGNFHIEAESSAITDTVKVSCLGYETLEIQLKNLFNNEKSSIYLSPITTEIPLVEIAGKALKYLKIGNPAWFSRGALYIDTHGQQTALYINNSDSLKGKIVKVAFYLSNKGNTDAPFRVRMYSRNSITGKPAADLLPEIIIVKPSGGSGWYNVNIALYEIDIPANGFFVAMEGIFPNEYSSYYEASGFKDISKNNNEHDNDFVPESITYGQQLGYNKGSANNTWHYSIDHNWFQLKKHHFNVMIAAEVKVHRNNWWNRISNWFENKK